MLPEGGGAFSVENSAIGIGNSFKNKSAPAAILRWARMDEIVLLSWSVDGWVCSGTLMGADKWDRSGTLAGADGLAHKFVLDLGTCLR